MFRNFLEKGGRTGGGYEYTIEQVAETLLPRLNKNWWQRMLALLVVVWTPVLWLTFAISLIQRTD